MTETASTPEEPAAQVEQADRIATLLTAAELEARVRDARAKREKVLAQRARQSPKTQASRQPPKIEPAHHSPEPESTSIAEPATPSPGPGPVKPPSPTPLKATPHAPAMPPTATPVLRAVRPAETAPRADTAAAPERARLSGRAALLAIACCLALGFGLSLGFGTVLTVGYFSQPHAEAPAPEASNGITTAELPALPADPAQIETAQADSPDSAPALPVFDITPEPPAPAEKPKIHVYAPQSVTTAALDQSKADLDRIGFETATVQRLRLTIAAPHVRFYDATDATVARALAQGLKIEARDFTHTGNGGPGRVEVWLDGTTTQRTASNRQNPVDELIRLGNRFIRSLQ